MKIVRNRLINAITAFPEKEVGKIKVIPKRVFLGITINEAHDTVNGKPFNADSDFKEKYFIRDGSLFIKPGIKVLTKLYSPAIFYTNTFEKAVTEALSKRAFLANDFIVFKNIE